MQMLKLLQGVQSDHGKLKTKELDHHITQLQNQGKKMEHIKGALIAPTAALKKVKAKF